ncbi:MAG: glycerophosphoryl diester phosphodiesterase membrane domain-containing protein [Erysipelotrichaceae bacterium]|nr:glycerophosphoryl diester phosphodiesterase membrane domain-containing protein [Erysipelotrichaceae bacterium]
MENIKKHFKSIHSLKLVTHNYHGLVRFELLYRILCLFVFFPLLIYIERLLPRINNTTIIAAYNVLDLLKRPWTYVILALILILVTVFAQLEQFGRISLLHASHDHVTVSASQAFSNAVDFMVNFFRLENILLIPYLLIVFPFGTLLDTSSITRFLRVPGFILEHFRKYPLVGFAYMVFAAAMLYMAFRLCYTLIIMCVEEIPFLPAAKKSFRFTDKEKGTRLLFALLKRFLLLAVLYLIGYLLLIVLTFAILQWLEPGFNTAKLEEINYYYLLVLVTTVLFSWIATPIIQSLLMDIYYKEVEAEGETVKPYEENQNYLSHRFVKITWILMIVVCSFFSVPERYRQFKWILKGDSNNTMIMAHRGYSDKAPENTLPAFEAAYEAGATAIELDVQMLKDGTIICLHDDSLSRTANLNKNVWEVTYDEIKNLDNGSFFSKSFARTRIPTLEEAIQVCRGKLYINIEIKRNGHDEGIEDKVVEIIRENEFQNFCDITSQDYDTLVYIHERYPDILLAYTSVIGIGEIQNLDAVDIISIQETFATFSNVEAMHRSGKKVFVWTVNERDTMDRLVALNVDAILTNDPVIGNEVLKEHTGITDFYKRLEQILYYLN